MTTTLPAPSDPLQMPAHLLSAREARFQIIALEEEQEKRGATPETTTRLVSLYEVLYPAACRCRMVDCPLCDPWAVAASGEESNDERL